MRVLVFAVAVAIAVVGMFLRIRKNKTGAALVVWVFSLLALAVALFMKPLEGNSGENGTTGSNETQVLSSSPGVSPTVDTTDVRYLGQDVHAYVKGSYYTEFSQASGKSFSMGGVQYYQGFTIGTFLEGSYACFNLDGQYKSLTGVAGNVDGKNYGLTYNVLGDGEMLSKIDIPGGGLPVPFDIDVTGVKELKIQATGTSNYYEAVGFGNVILNR